MKKLLLSTLLAAALTLSAADVTGTWTGSFVPSGAPEGAKRPAHLILKQEGEKLTGSGGPNGTEQQPISNGKVDGDTVTFEIEQGDHIMHFTLKQSGDDAMAGQISREAHGEKQTASMTLTRQK